MQLRCGSVAAAFLWCGESLETEWGRCCSMAALGLRGSAWELRKGAWGLHHTCQQLVGDHWVAYV